MAHKCNVTTKGGELYIEGDIYQKQVAVPDIQDVLLMSDQQKTELARLQIAVGPEVQEEGNRFFSYSAKSSNFEHIKQMYLRPKNMHLAATHIVCAYRLFGPKCHTMQDYCDDNEYGAGRAILQELKKKVCSTKWCL